MGSVARWRSVTRRERPRSATTAERWRLLEAIERSRSAGGAGVSGGGRNATLGSVAREAQRERRCVAGVPPISGTHRPQGRSMSIRKKPRPFGRGFPCLKQTIVLFFQVTSWHRKKSTYTQWSQSHPMHRAPALARHRPLGRSRFHNTPALQSHR